MQRISIVTPCFNKRLFIAEAIESVLAQEGDFSIEYFVMDGGSQDGSAETIEKYARQVAAGEWKPRCRDLSFYWQSRRDRGQTDAINQGLRRATGDVASYLNADDAYMPGAFAKVLGEFRAHPEADFIYGDGEVIGANSELQWEWLSRPYSHSVMTSYHYLWNDFTNYILQQATFWRRDVIEKIGLFDETFHFAMDVEYWIRAGQAHLKLIHVPEKLGRFRLIPDTKSLSSPTAFWEDQLEIFRRSRGAARMGRYLTFFCLNVGKECAWDLEAMDARIQRVFERWQSLPETERQVLRRRAARGLSRACLLGAFDCLSRGERAKSQSLFARAVHHSQMLRLDPLACPYYGKRFLGDRLFLTLQQSFQSCVGIYRRRRFDYRYHPKRLRNLEAR